MNELTDRAKTDEGRNCRYCRSFISDKLRDGLDGEGKYSMYWPGRCEIIGVLPGVQLVVRSDHTCNAQVRDDAKCWWLKDLVVPRKEEEDG